VVEEVAVEMIGVLVAKVADVMINQEMKDVLATDVLQVQETEVNEDALTKREVIIVLVTKETEDPLNRQTAVAQKDQDGLEDANRTLYIEQV
jgi:hypothetical protein